VYDIEVNTSTNSYAISAKKIADKIYEQKLPNAWKTTVEHANKRVNA